MSDTQLFDDDFESEPDFGAVARERAEQQEVLRLQAAEGTVAPDIAAALADPATSDLLLFRGFEVVADLALLRGAETGHVDVPDRLSDPEVPARLDVSDPWRCTLLYRKLLVEGSAAEQARLLNRSRLRQLWPSRLGPDQVLTVWENRFPELRRGA